MIDALLISSSPIFGLTGFVNVHTISKMKITFDAGKDAINVAKHGTSLALASTFEWNEAVTWPDQRREYGEKRMIGLGYIGDRLYILVFVDRNETRRIISLRKANKREENFYAQT